ncbi:substrate-binding periplasmic protein [Aeromonas australiensis]|uniref:substrate-binding periplasmic protein n=1 Tax=Aeromonas australiensis TaxID=1114880 RepID=UPI000694C8F9|nr:transporter substrate-binding domain-containing protein [Aeromonas australiensis]
MTILSRIYLFKKILGFPILFIIFFSSAVTSLEDKTIRLVSSEYPPYFSESLPQYGLISEIITEAYKRVGYKTKIVFLPWSRAIREAQLGEYDGMFALWHRSEREEWFVFSKALPANEIGFYKRGSEQITFKNLDELKSYKIGTVRGYANPPEFESANLTKHEVKTDEQNIVKLYLGRVDLVLIDRGVASFLIDTKYPKFKNSLEWLQPPIETVSQHLAISKRTSNYKKKMEDFNLGLEKIEKEGLLEKIMTKHGFLAHLSEVGVVDGRVR